MSVEFDSKNNLWLHCRSNDGMVGSNLGYGLTKFDGSIWTTYNIANSGIPSNSIMDITIDKEDNIWLATYGGGVGVTRYNGTNWQSYDVNNSGIAKNEVSRILIDDYRERIWFSHLSFSGLSTAKLNLSQGVSVFPSVTNEKVEGFTVYPNPTTSHLSLRFNGIVPETMTIYDVSGKIIALRKADLNTEHPIALSELNISSSGLFLIKITDQSGKAHYQKIIVKH
jgi:hypothetical protein